MQFLEKQLGRMRKKEEINVKKRNNNYKACHAPPVTNPQPSNNIPPSQEAQNAGTPTNAVRPSTGVQLGTCQLSMGTPAPQNMRQRMKQQQLASRMRLNGKYNNYNNVNNL